MYLWVTFGKLQRSVGSEIAIITMILKVWGERDVFRE